MAAQVAVRAVFSNCTRSRVICRRSLTSRLSASANLGLIVAIIESGYCQSHAAKRAATTPITASTIGNIHRITAFLQPHRPTLRGAGIIANMRSPVDIEKCPWTALVQEDCGRLTEEVMLHQRPSQSYVDLIRVEVTGVRASPSNYQVSPSSRATPGFLGCYWSYGGGLTSLRWRGTVGQQELISENAICTNNKKFAGCCLD